MIELNKIRLFSDLEECQLEVLAQHSHRVSFKSGDTIVHENETAHSLLIILEGNIEVIKHYEGHVVSLGQYGEGFNIGDMNLYHRQQRTASVVCLTEVKALEIEYDALQQLVADDHGFYSILHRIGQGVVQNLVQSNHSMSESFRRERKLSEIRYGLGQVFVVLTTMLCGFAIFASNLHRLLDYVPNETYVTAPLMLLFMVGMGWVFYSSGLPLKSFGLTLDNAKVAIYESMMISLFFIVMLTVVRYLWMVYSAQVDEASLFNPFGNLDMIVVDGNPWLTWFSTLMVYMLFIAPVQEVMIRGGLQATLQHFLTGKYHTLQAIVVSNVVFGSAHTYLSTRVIGISFIAGLIWGYLFYRHKTLVGVVLSHGLLGGYYFWVLGLGM